VWHATENGRKRSEPYSENRDSLERPRYEYIWEDSFEICVENCGVRTGLDAVKCEYDIVKGCCERCDALLVYNFASVGYSNSAVLHGVSHFKNRTNFTLSS
jgi:hypothetical protein